MNVTFQGEYAVVHNGNFVDVILRELTPVPWNQPALEEWASAKYTRDFVPPFTFTYDSDTFSERIGHEGGPYPISTSRALNAFVQRAAKFSPHVVDAYSYRMSQSLNYEVTFTTPVQQLRVVSSEKGCVGFRTFTGPEVDASFIHLLMDSVTVSQNGQITPLFCAWLLETYPEIASPDAIFWAANFKTVFPHIPFPAENFRSSEEMRIREMRAVLSGYVGRVLRTEYLTLEDAQFLLRHSQKKPTTVLL
jgi:hypothetical protein